MHKCLMMVPAVVLAFLPSAHSNSVTAQGDNPIRARRLHSSQRQPSYEPDADTKDPISIVGPESVKVGKLYKLDASGSDVQTFSWIFPGMSDPNTWEIFEGGKVVSFAIDTPGTYYFVFSGAKSDGPDKPPKLYQRECKVVATGPTPQPVDPIVPGPDPVTPEPSIPQGRFGLARFIKDNVTAGIPVTDRTLCAQFSANYTSIVSALKQKTVSGMNGANAALAEKNRATAGTGIEKWKSGVFTALGNKIKDLVTSKQVNPTNSTDLIDMFSEIAEGFAISSGN